MIKLSPIDNKGSSYQVKQEVIRSSNQINLICTTFIYTPDQKDRLYHIVRDDKTVLGEFKDYVEAVKCMDYNVSLSVEINNFNFMDFDPTIPLDPMYNDSLSNLI